MSAITTHVLDTSRGSPAAGVVTILFRANDDGWDEIGRSPTDDNGRVATFDTGDLTRGTYRLRFELDDYFADHALTGKAFYPYAEIAFRVEDPSQHYHVPLLLSPFGYSTYRGS